jgi:Cu/Ag efflux protein CusF
MKHHHIGWLLATVLAIAASPAVAQSVSGTITKINEAEGKLTIDHGPIKNLDMDGMTMVFRVADPAMLKSVKAGDRVRFDADRINGAITVIKMQKAR